MGGPHRPGYFKQYYQEHKADYRRRDSGPRRRRQQKEREDKYKLKYPNWNYARAKKYRERFPEKIRALSRKYTRRNYLETRFMHISKHIKRQCRKFYKLNKKDERNYTIVDVEYWRLIQPQIDLVIRISTKWIAERRKRVVLDEDEGAELRASLAHLLKREVKNEELPCVVQRDTKAQEETNGL